ncbi:MAG TPA: TetR/AcrR family transcriptional regulator [Acidimicrobiales bacterium]
MFSEAIADKVEEQRALAERKVEEQRRRLVEKVERKSPRLADKLAEKLDEKGQRLVDKLDQKARKVTDKIERYGDTIDRFGSVAAAIDLWTRQRPARRQPRFDLDQIADAALHIADTEGLDALSMRRLAAELGCGTMTLYHYVKTKDELLALLADRVMAEIVLPPEVFAEGWRAGMAAIARRTREVVLRHPWWYDLSEDPSIGPNSIRHFDQSLQALAGLDIPLREKLDIIQVVDEYVFGHCLQSREGAGLDDPAALTPDVRRYLVDLAGSGAYPQISALVEEHGLERLLEEVGNQDDDARFERNLARILDGIERDLP